MRRCRWLVGWTGWLGLVVLIVGTAYAQVRGEAVIEVRLQIIPFYAVDRDGRPVLDLKKEEVEVWVDGHPVPVATLDRYVFGETRQVETPSPLKPLPRHVFLLFDLAFLSHWGFVETRDVALRIGQHLRETDRVYLLLFSARRGLRQVWGPVTGRQAVIARLQATLGLERMKERATKPTEAEEAVTVPSSTASNQKGEAEIEAIVAEELQEIKRSLRHFGEWTYQTAARRLAEAFGGLAAVMRFLPGPKVLIVFSEGIRTEVYHQGLMRSPSELNPMLPTSLAWEFEEPLRRLTAAGVLTMFVNPAGHRLSQSDPASGELSLRHMAAVTGGLYIEGAGEERLRERVERWTTAYYEAGLYVEKPRRSGRFHRVEVRVKRPGVRVWTIQGFRDPETFGELSGQERTVAIVHVLPRALEAWTWLGLRLRPLKQDVSVRLSATRRGRVRCEMEAPEAWRGKKLEFYSVLFTSDVHRRMGPAQDVRVIRKRIRKAGTRIVIEQPVPASGPYIWAIVAVDPKDGQAWLHRVYLSSRLDVSQ